MTTKTRPETAASGTLASAVPLRDAARWLDANLRARFGSTGWARIDARPGEPGYLRLTGYDLTVWASVRVELAEDITEAWPHVWVNAEDLAGATKALRGKVDVRSGAKGLELGDGRHSYHLAPLHPQMEPAMPGLGAPVGRTTGELGRAIKALAPLASGIPGSAISCVHLSADGTGAALEATNRNVAARVRLDWEARPDLPPATLELLIDPARAASAAAALREGEVVVHASSDRRSWGATDGWAAFVMPAIDAEYPDLDRLLRAEDEESRLVTDRAELLDAISAAGRLDPSDLAPIRWEAAGGCLELSGRSRTGKPSATVRIEAAGPDTRAPLYLARELSRQAVEFAAPATHVALALPGLVGGPETRTVACHVIGCDAELIQTEDDRNREVVVARINPPGGGW